MGDDPGSRTEHADHGESAGPAAGTSRAPAASASAPALRDTALDGLRTLAVLLMIASHTTRLIVWDSRRDWSRWSLIIEPLTASLFLILVGASLFQSREKARRDGTAPAAWLRRQALRAGALWLTSIVFYTVSEGFQFPDAIFLSGILCTIAYNILAGSLLLLSPRPVLALGAASAAMGAAYLWLDLRGQRVFLLNAGNSPMFPLSLFGMLGALGCLLRARWKWTGPLLVAAAAMTMAGLLWRHDFVALFTKPLGRYETVREFLLHRGGAEVPKSIPYYNIRTLLAPAILSLAVLAYAALALLRPLLDPAARWLFRLGRRSLDAYVLHLALLAVLVTAGGKRPLKESWQGDAVYLGAVALCYAWVWGRDAWAARRRRR